MIPDFDEHGLLPPGVHECTLEEIGQRFCWTDRRKDIFNGLCAFITRECRPRVSVFVDGSFVRNKALPDDVDVVLELTDLPADDVLHGLSIWFRHDEIKTNYNVDVWSRHPKFPNDLSIFFQYLGDKAAAELCLPIKHPKGLLMVRS